MRLSGWKVPVEHLSSTQLATLLTCAEQYRLRYIKHEPERLNVPQLVGSAFHETLADNWRWKMETGEDLQEDTAWERFQGAWDSTIEKEGEPEWTETPSSLLTTGAKMVGTYMGEAAPSTTPLATEQWFEERLPDIPVPVVGIVDLETKTTIQETKTTHAKLTKPKPKWTIQARIYQLLTRKPVAYQIVTRQVTPKIYTSASEPGLLCPVADPDVTVQMLQQAVTLLNDLYARHGPDRPWPANGVLHPFLCSYCSYRGGRCWAWKGEPLQ